MRYGYFDDAHREYVITRPDTPWPWINYLGSQAYFGLISNTAGGYSFYKDARLRRLTRYRYNNVPLDTGGRYIYVRDDDDGAFWSPSWQPTRQPLKDYACRHGMGYSVIGGVRRQIEVRTRYFVPLDETLELWQCTVTNHRAEPAALSLFSCVEFALWDAHDDATNFQRNFNTGEVEIEDEVIYHKTEYRERRDHFAYFACSEPLAGFDTQREDFLGPYRGWDAPIVVEEGAARDSVAHGWSPIGVHHVRLALAPNESRQVIFVLGYHEVQGAGGKGQGAKFDPPDSQRINKQSVQPIIEQYRDPAAVDAAFAALGEHWDALLARFHVETPSEHVNRMINIWNTYQCMVTFNLSRSASYFESGVGRGMGFRDSNQDILGFVHIIPERARERLLDLAATQLEDGGAYHQYQPLTKRGNDAVGSGFNDDPLWLILAAAAYLKETGDFSLLDEPTPYENEPGSETPFYKHLIRAARYTLNNLGPHGLPLIGHADWNDCLNLNTFSEEPGESFQLLQGREGDTAESLFIAGQFVLAAEALAAIAHHHDEPVDEAWLVDAAREMTAAVAAHGWDGGWFLRAYDDFGEKVGSQANDEGQIFIEPQGMCVMAGIGQADGRAAQALDAVHERLATEHGIVLHQPAYTRYHVELGEISTYPPGYKENAGIFCHANPWIIIAEAQVGRADRAFDYYTRICPSAREAISALHRCEPYVYAQMIAGKDAPSFGEAKNSWLTGTAAWNFVAITQWILGIRPTHRKSSDPQIADAGLRIAPVIPANWEGFTATRVFRGVTYHIEVRREMGHGEVPFRGIKNAGPNAGNEVALTVDGDPVKGNIVPLPKAGVQEVHVEAVIG